MTTVPTEFLIPKLVVRPVRSARQELRALEGNDSLPLQSANWLGQSDSSSSPGTSPPQGGRLDWEMHKIEHQRSGHTLVVLVEQASRLVWISVLPKKREARHWYELVLAFASELGGEISRTASWARAIGLHTAPSIDCDAIPEFIIDNTVRKDVRPLEDTCSEIRSRLDQAHTVEEIGQHRLTALARLLNQLPRPATRGIAPIDALTEHLFPDNVAEWSPEFREDRPSVIVWAYPYSWDLERIGLAMASAPPSQDNPLRPTNHGTYRSLGEIEAMLTDLALQWNANELTIPPADLKSYWLTLARSGPARVSPDFNKRSFPPIPATAIRDVPLLSYVELTAKGYHTLEGWSPDPKLQWWPSIERRSWSKRAQSVFDQHWDNSLDPVVNELLDTYGSVWVRHVVTALSDESPAYVQQQADLCEQGAFFALDAPTVDEALRHGIYHLFVGQRDWEFPVEETCDLCGGEHFVDSVRSYVYRQLGGRGICDRCGANACLGQPKLRSGYPVDEMLGTLKRLSDITESIPGANLHRDLGLSALTRSQRRIAVACMLALPDSTVIRQLIGVEHWIEVLIEAGVVEGGMRTARGTVCLAQDGHRCLSLGEKTIDDWLYRRGIPHDIEPNWPMHPVYNPNGRKRADFRVGEAYIEYAGLVGDEDYDKRMVEKVLLAAALDIKLVVVKPADLARLEEKLGPLRPLARHQ